MKKPFVQITFFLLALSVLAWLTEKVLDFGLRHNYDFKPALVASGRVRPDVLLEGNSRVGLMLNSALFTQQTGLSCYNLGMNGCNVEHQLALLRLWLLYNPPPKALLVEFSPEYLQETGLGFQSAQFIEVLHQEPFRSLVREHDPRLLTVSYFPLLKYALYNQALVGEALTGLWRWITGQTQDISRWNGYEATPYTQFDGTFDQYRREHPNGYELPLSPRRVQLYDDLFTLARQHGIRVLVYEAPTLNEALRLHRNRDQMLATADSLFRAKNVFFLPVDTTHFGTSRRYFFNANHLTAAGTDAFTKQLGRQLLPQLRGIRSETKTGEK